MVYYFLLVARYFLIFVRYFLLVVRYFLLVARYFLLVACYFFVRRMLWNYNINWEKKTIESVLISVLKQNQIDLI